MNNFKVILKKKNKANLINNTLNNILISKEFYKSFIKLILISNKSQIPIFKILP